METFEDINEMRINVGSIIRLLAGMQNKISGGDEKSIDIMQHILRIFNVVKFVVEKNDADVMEKLDNISTQYEKKLGICESDEKGGSVIDMFRLKRSDDGLGDEQQFEDMINDTRLQLSRALDSREYFVKSVSSIQPQKIEILTAKIE